jgi:hypothetical protein
MLNLSWLSLATADETMAPAFKSLLDFLISPNVFGGNEGGSGEKAAEDSFWCIGVGEATGPLGGLGITGRGSLLLTEPLESLEVRAEVESLRSTGIVGVEATGVVGGSIARGVSVDRCGGSGGGSVGGT